MSPDPTPVFSRPLPAPLVEYGQYRCLYRFGRQGGMSQTWLAQHAAFPAVRLFVVKLMKPELTASDRARDLFVSEAESLMNVRHLNVVDILDYGFHPARYLVMEHLFGPTLWDLTPRWSPVSGASPGLPNLARAVDLLAQACAGVAAFHQRGLIHRDIKPSNLMVCDWLCIADCVKVIDLGLVCPTPAVIAELDGTPPYMAPEQFVERSTMDERSDIYALGCVAYFVLTGRAPFVYPGGSTGRPEAEWFATAHATAPRVPLSTYNPRVPLPISEVVLRAINPNPDDRYQTVSAFRNALRACPLPDTWTPADARSLWDDPNTTAWVNELQRPIDG